MFGGPAPVDSDAYLYLFVEIQKRSNQIYGKYYRKHV